MKSFTIVKDWDEDFYTLYREGTKKFKTPEGSYDSWSNDINEAEHFFAHDAVAEAKNYSIKTTPVRVQVKNGKYMVSEVTINDYRDWLLDVFKSDVCYSRADEVPTKNSYTGVEYPKEWVATAEKIKSYINCELDKLC